MHLQAVKNYLYLFHLFVKYNKFTINKIFFTVAKHCKDATNSPPTFRPKDLLPLCNNNSINLCICREVIHHRTLYLYMYIQYNNFIKNQ